MLLFMVSSCNKDPDTNPKNDACAFEFILDGIPYSSNECNSSVSVFTIDSIATLTAYVDTSVEGFLGSNFGAIINSNEALPIHFQYPPPNFDNRWPAKL